MTVKLDWLKRGCHNVLYRFVPKKVGIHKLKDGTFIEQYHAGNKYIKDNNSYVFLYRFKPTPEGKNGWYAYILEIPDFKGRESNTHITHKFLDKDGKYYICYSGQANTIEQIQAIAHRWAEAIQKYINTGVCQF